MHLLRFLPEFALSVFCKDIAASHSLPHPTGSHVLDLGCSPGAWLQVACQALGPAHKNGCVIGVDVQVIAASHACHLLSQCCHLHQQIYTASSDFCKSTGEGYCGRKRKEGIL